MRILIVLALLLALILVGATAGEIRDIRRGLSSEAWPTTEAVVTVARYSRNQKRFEYEYEVDGRRYLSQNAGFALSPFHQEYRLHDVGDTIRIHYDPDSPNRAVVKPGVTAPGVAAGFIPILFLAGFMVFVAVHVRSG